VVEAAEAEEEAAAVRIPARRTRNGSKSEARYAGTAAGFCAFL
jgi:hypothetical protein